MAEILVTHSYLLELDPKQKRIGQPLAPLGTLYAASVLRESGFAVSFYDPTFSDSPDRIIPELQKEKPALLVIYDDGFSYLSKMCLANMRDSAFRMIGLGHAYGAAVVVNSSDASDHYSPYLGRHADYVIRGEGEITLKELAGRILREPGRACDDIPGLAFKLNEQIRVTAPRPILENPDDLPFPAWDLLDAETYRRAWKSKNRYFSLNLVTTRGCPYNCIWCAKPIYGNQYKSRSPQNVVQEMIHVHHTLSPDLIWFADDIFGLKPGWIGEFENELARQKLKIPFIIQSRVDLLTGNNLVESLAQAGCRKIWLGIESGSQRILDAMHKGITLDQIRTASPLIRRSGIEQAFFLQLGFPGETTQDIRQTIRLLTDLMPEDVGISVTYPLPGTKFYDSVKEKLAGKSHWEDSDDLSLLFNSTFSPRYYKILHRYIHKHFRYRQSIFYLNHALTAPGGLNRSRLRRIVLLPYYLTLSLAYLVLLRMHEHDGEESL
jgi:anaerobic magnesium-protoporphyrin IX monomethyl ester cyclase